MQTIKLTTCEVDIIDRLTWGQVQQINNVIIAGAKVGTAGLSGFDTGSLMESKYKLLEIAVKEIRFPDGTKQTFTRQWMDDLSVDDGDALYNAVDALSKKK